MASLSGIKAGLVPVESEAHEAARLAKASMPKPKPAPDEVICECCGGQVGFNSGRKTHTSPCKHCRTFFGVEGEYSMGLHQGVTADDYEEALEKLAKIREAGWLMILRVNTFGIPGGGTMTVEPGDVFSFEHAGDPELLAQKTGCSRDRTWALFTARIKVGPHELTCFTHEVSAIPWLTVMALKKEGQLIEQYVSADDRHGHFAPSAELREEIYDTFGGLTGRLN